MDKLEKSIKYTFQDKELLLKALTHSSYTEEMGLSREMCNQRLEFLGDAVIELAVREYIFNSFERKDEGELSKMKSALVRSESLASVARDINLGDYLRLGKGARMINVHMKNSTLEDAIEAIIGAVFCESGYEKSREVTLALLENPLKEIANGRTVTDYKSRLQELVQKHGCHSIKYSVISEHGKSHDKTFEVELTVDGKRLGVGKGKSKKAAETMAAKMAINKI